MFLCFLLKIHTCQYIVTWKKNPTLNPSIGVLFGDFNSSKGKWKLTILFYVQTAATKVRRGLRQNKTSLFDKPPFFVWRVLNFNVVDFGENHTGHWCKLSVKIKIGISEVVFGFSNEQIAINKANKQGKLYANSKQFLREQTTLLLITPLIPIVLILNQTCLLHLLGQYYKQSIVNRTKLIHDV